MKLKKLLASILCVAMVLSTMGTVVFAENATVATVNGTPYTDIQEAIAAAAPSGTVEIANDVTVDEWIMFSQRLSIGSGQIITLDMNGLTIKGNGKTLTVNSVESATNGDRLFHEADNLNIENLTINYADGVVGGISLKSGELKDVTINGGVGVFPGTGDITITGCEFNTNGSAIYNEEARDNLVVTGNTFNTAVGQYAIYLRGNTTFTNNTVVNGKVNVVSGSPVVTGNDFGNERFKVYNKASATIEDNKINVLVFDDEEGVAPNVMSTFAENILSAEAEAALVDAGVIYLIDNIDELKAFRDSVNAGNNYAGKYVKLNADIDLSSVDSWTPIGDTTYNNKYAPVDASKVFSGVFDGNDKVISNLKIERILDGGADADANLGLFGITGEGAVIKDLTITNVDIDTDGRNVGALAGFAYKATLNNITVNGNIQIKGGNNVSGVCGMTRHYAMSATNITVSGADGSAITGNNIVGGIFAEIAPNGSAQTFEGLSVENVAINGVGGVGGIVGLLTNGSVSNVSVKDVALTGRTEWNGDSMGRIRMGSVAGLMGGHGPSTISDATIENVTGKNLDNETVTLPVIGANYDASSNATEARIGDKYYATLADALKASVDGDTITLIWNEGDEPIAMNGAVFGKSITITGDAVVDWSKGWLFVGRGGEGDGKLIFDNANLTSTEESLKNGSYGIHVSMEEYGETNKSDGEVVFKNSNIDLSYLMNKHKTTVDGGKLTVYYGFAVGARPASETNGEQRTAEMNLVNNAVVEVKNHNGMGIGYESAGILNVEKGSTLDYTGTSLAVVANGTINSKGNIFGKLSVSAGATMNLTGGFYTEDPSQYLSDDYESEISAADETLYTVVPKAAQKIDVVFEATGVTGEYIIKLVSADGKEIYEFTSAELTFQNDSVSLGGTNGNLPFEFVENSSIDVEKSLEKADTYIFKIKNAAKEGRITDDEIELGTIKFTSQGKHALSVTDGKVVATRYNTNLPKYYVANDATAKYILDISATLDGDLVPDTTRNVAVNIAYNLGLVGKVWADDEIKVTLVDSFGKEYTATVNADQTVFAFEDVKTGRITVKLSAPGFRTYTYDAILYEGETPLVLNFWNNVKTGEEEDPLAKIDNSNAIEAKMAHNFVVGDIVMDFIVDRYDLAAVTSYYGMYDITGRENAASKYLKYDLNRDGNIDIIDVHYVLHTFGN